MIYDCFLQCNIIDEKKIQIFLFQMQISWKKYIYKEQKESLFFLLN